MNAPSGETCCLRSGPCCASRAWSARRLPTQCVQIAGSSVKYHSFAMPCHPHSAEACAWSKVTRETKFSSLPRNTYTWTAGDQHGPTGDSPGAAMLSAPLPPWGTFIEYWPVSMTPWSHSLRGQKGLVCNYGTTDGSETTRAWCYVETPENPVGDLTRAKTHTNPPAENHWADYLSVDWIYLIWKFFV